MINRLEDRQRGRSKRYVNTNRAGGDGKELNTNPYFHSGQEQVKPKKGPPRIFYERRFCKRFGLKLEEYQANITNGLKYCTKHREWEPIENFYTNPHHSYACKRWICEHSNGKGRGAHA
jgi:hypothetical protein